MATDSDRMLGFAAFAVEGGETMSSVQVAIIAAALPYTALRDAVLTHPRLAEGIGALFSSEPSTQNQSMRMAGQG